MLAKKELQKKAKGLRSKGYSCAEIARLLKVSKSSASLWIRKVELSSHALERIKRRREIGRINSAKALSNKRIHREDVARKTAHEILKKVNTNKENLLLICAMVYYCEGNKTDGSVGFINSDPRLIRTFVELLRDTIPLDKTKFRGGVHLHDYHNTKEQLQFWSQTTRIPLYQFIKPYRKPHTGIRTKEGYQGCVSVRYHDTAVHRLLIAIAQGFMKKYYPNTGD